MKNSELAFNPNSYFVFFLVKLSYNFRLLVNWIKVYQLFTTVVFLVILFLDHETTS